jgi:cyclic pyranopterin phosphate synthase
VDVEFEIGMGEIDIVATARASDRTGVEMEALLAVSVAALTTTICARQWTRDCHKEVKLLEKTKERRGRERLTRNPGSAHATLC